MMEVWSLITGVHVGGCPKKCMKFLQLHGSCLDKACWNVACSVTWFSSFLVASTLRLAHDTQLLNKDLKELGLRSIGKDMF
jgi:hypothetical protein